MPVGAGRVVVSAAVLAPVDRLGVAGRVKLRVAQVRVQLVDDRRTHLNEIQPTDAELTVFHVEHVQYLGRRQALQRIARSVTHYGRPA